MHVLKMVYITRWKEAGSYQHGDCFPHTSGQTGILLVGSSSRYISLHFQSNRPQLRPPLHYSFAAGQELQWMERNANSQILKDILRNQCDSCSSKMAMAIGNPLKG